MNKNYFSKNSDVAWVKANAVTRDLVVPQAATEYREYKELKLHECPLRI